MAESLQLGVPHRHHARHRPGAAVPGHRAAGPDAARDADQPPATRPPTSCSCGTARRRPPAVTTRPTRAGWPPTQVAVIPPPSPACTTCWSAASPSRRTTRRSRCWPNWCRWPSPACTPTSAATPSTSPPRSAAPASTPTRSSSWCGPASPSTSRSSYQVIDATKIIATFDLTGAPHGLYDLKVINPGGETAVIPYRFLVEQAIEPDVTIGVGGPRFILAGDVGTYSVALQSLSNLDTPYVVLPGRHSRDGRSTSASTTCRTCGSTRTSAAARTGRDDIALGRRSTRRSTPTAPSLAAGLPVRPGGRRLHRLHLQRVHLPRPARAARPGLGGS